MKYRDNKGFVHLHVVIPIIAVLIVGAIGAWVWSSSKAEYNLAVDIRTCRDTYKVYLRASSTPQTGNAKACAYTLQHAMRVWSPNSVTFDGWYGSQTAGVVKQWQNWYNATTNPDIVADGEVGTQTWNALENWWVNMGHRTKAGTTTSTAPTTSATNNTTTVAKNLTCTISAKWLSNTQAQITVRATNKTNSTWRSVTGNYKTYAFKNGTTRSVNSQSKAISVAPFATVTQSITVSNLNKADIATKYRTYYTITGQTGGCNTAEF